MIVLIYYAITGIKVYHFVFHFLHWLFLWQTYDGVIANFYVTLGFLWFLFSGYRFYLYNIWRYDYPMFLSRLRDEFWMHSDLINTVVAREFAGDHEDILLRRAFNLTDGTVAIPVSQSRGFFS